MQGVGISSKASFDQLSKRRLALAVPGSSKRRARKTAHSMFAYAKAFTKQMHIILKQAWLKGNFQKLINKRKDADMAASGKSVHGLESAMLEAILGRIVFMDPVAIP